ncbi:eukaryotic translation initiation factor 4B-like isoform X2 [Patiria miniata]|uniref:RRM domain-containing protein n=1 Tax=Patiria miniata TaxID=46514 RepID=A0A913YXL4_PATMI|nr:eukaryotic translation initiation factor 4B-like isoform X2 [Patiria miniata]
MAAQGKKKKVKGKTLNLNDFLSDGTSNAPGTSYVMANKSWAEQTDEAEDTVMPFMDTKPLPNRAALPTAPRSAQPSEIDRSKLPDKPPYTVYLGNIPFDADEMDITNFLVNCNVSQVRLPKEGDRLKGFGYAEVDDMESLMTALALNDQTIRTRRIRVDLAGQNHQDGKDDRTNSDWRARSSDGGSSFGRGEDRRGNRYSDRYQDRSSYDRYGDADRGYGFDRRTNDGSYGGRRNDDFGSSGGSSEDNWRRAPAEPSSSAFENRSRGGGFGGDRDRGFGNDRGFGSDRDRGFGGDRDRGFGGDRDRGFGGDRDRGFGGDRDRGFGGDRDRGFGSDRDRGFGGDRDRGFGGDRDRSFGGDRDQGFGGDRDWGDRGSRSRGFENFSEPRDRSFGDRDRGFRDRDYGERDGRRPYGGGGFSRGADQDGPPESGHEQEGPRERKKLVLTKRSDHPGETPAPSSKPSSSIFGAAKPVDTAARERAIEERIERERRLEEQEKMKSEKDKETIVRRERPERPRRESEGEGRTRHSSSSSGKGGPRPIIARRESERSNEDDSAFHKEEPLSPTSPTAPKSPKTPISPREEVSLQNAIPAPPPKENAWAKRSETVTSPPPSSVSSQSHTSPPSREADGSRHRGEGRQETGGSESGRQYREAGPPKENAWKRDGKPAAGGRGEQGGYSDHGGPGAGRGDPQAHPARDNRRKEERPVKKTPAEMPKYEKPPPPNWSQPNKFSSLMTEDDPQGSD